MTPDLSITAALTNAGRLAALDATALVGSEPDASFDRLTRLATHLLHTPIALVALVGADGAFFKSCIGAPEGTVPPSRQVPLSHSICKHVVHAGVPLVIENARLDPLVRENGAVADLAVGAYLGFPLMSSDGHCLGSFCTIDMKPREWSATDISLLGDLAASVMTEIALRTAARAADARLLDLVESESRYRAIITASDDAIYTYDADGLVTSWNPGAERIFGWTAAEMLGFPCARIVPPELADEERHMRAALAEGIRFTSKETRRVARCGDLRSVAISAVPLADRDGRMTAFIVTIRDYTRKRSLEAQLRQAQKMEAVGRLAGGIAHDFNNLLSVVASAGQFLKRDLPEQSPLRADVDDIVAVAERGASLTRQLLSFSRRQSAQPRLVELDDLVAGGRRLLERIAHEEIALRLHLGAAGDAVHADPGQLEQALVNLVVNARDAIDGAGVVTIRTERRVLGEPRDHPHGLIPAGQYVVLAVRDDGAGMTDDIRDRLFEPFFTTKEPGRGTGLGLATVHGIVAQADGHVTVESTPGAGTVMSLWLPLAAGRAETSRAREDAGPLAGGTATVLLVEDDPMLRRQARRTLADCGYTVLEAGGGVEALAVADAHRGAVDLLVTDVVMPGMSGVALVDVLARSHPDIAVLFTSGYPDEHARQPVGGDAGFLAKPFTPGALTRAVRAALDRPLAA